MKRMGVMFLTVCLAMFFLIPATMAEEKWYVGSEKCADCHMDNFNDWQASGHPYKLRRAEKVRYTGIPLPKGYSWDDITYVIGGATKKARFIDKKGFIITTAKDGSPAKTQYNLWDGSWANYHAGEKKPYKCGPCHMTAYDKKGHKDGLPGMIGDWPESGVGCEECHGPGSAHAYMDEPDKKSIVVDTAGEKCGKCHQRGSMDIPPLAKKGLIRHHEQFNEVNTGPHEGTDCVECHNPHKRAINVKAKCTDCHDDDKFIAQAKTIHGKSAVTCVDCHMPRATKSAIKTGKFAGDTRSHLVKINVDPMASMFKPGMLKGKKVTFAEGFVTLEYSCLNCHGARDKKWAAEKAKGYHDE
ncbi:MAG: hypothetical protein HOD85_20070 [Deltaproteobacteria bacterium]|nr:hypothetical protein [Deltaproteobacteria bacterium]